MHRDGSEAAPVSGGAEVGTVVTAREDFEPDPFIKNANLWPPFRESIDWLPIRY
jgi:hypothetical protein